MSFRLSRYILSVLILDSLVFDPSQMWADCCSSDSSSRVVDSGTPRAVWRWEKNMQVFSQLQLCTRNQTPLLRTIYWPSSFLPQHSPQTNSSVFLVVSQFYISFTDPPDCLIFITKRGQTPMHSVFSGIISKSQKQILHKIRVYILEITFSWRLNVA